ncbi:MAG: SH3 domain-containing protein [Clostridia bacterium]|nr:SH3 domain-containing protein [Clostridia bacterium]
MAKKLDANKIILIIAAGLIAIAVLITCVASIYEHSLKDKGETKPDVSVSETVNKDDKTPDTTKADANKPDTTKSSATTNKNGAGKYKVITKDDPLGIRIQAAKDSERVSEIPKGAEVEILTVFDKWGYVSYNGVGGWVSMEYVELVSATNVTVKHEPGKYTIATQDDPLGIRTKPEQDAERAGEVPKGEEVEILAVYGEWGYVEYNGINGWLSFQYLKKA